MESSVYQWKWCSRLICIFCKCKGWSHPSINENDAVDSSAYSVNVRDGVIRLSMIMMQSIHLAMTVMESTHQSTNVFGIPPSINQSVGVDSYQVLNDPTRFLTKFSKKEKLFFCELRSVGPISNKRVVAIKDGHEFFSSRCAIAFSKRPFLLLELFKDSLCP